jgi:predicted RNA-binding Zn-ribbon protein involved in translation (DUF1610 family)
MDDDNNNVIKIQPRVKSHDENRPPLEPVFFRECEHKRFFVDDALDEVECQDCGERMNPIWVLKQIANRQSSLAMELSDFRGRVKRQRRELESRKRFKCGECGATNDITRCLRMRVIKAPKQ